MDDERVERYFECVVNSCFYLVGIPMIVVLGVAVLPLAVIGWLGGKAVSACSDKWQYPGELDNRPPAPKGSGGILSPPGVPLSDLLKRNL
jgi:hypothetical protein